MDRRSEIARFDRGRVCIGVYLDAMDWRSEIARFDRGRFWRQRMPRRDDERVCDSRVNERRWITIDRGDFLSTLWRRRTDTYNRRDWQTMLNNNRPRYVISERVPNAKTSSIDSRGLTNDVELSTGDVWSCSHTRDLHANTFRSRGFHLYSVLLNTVNERCW